LSVYFFMALLRIITHHLLCFIILIPLITDSFPVYNFSSIALCLDNLCSLPTQIFFSSLFSPVSYPCRSWFPQTARHHCD
jgi:hypothetical protein